DTLLAVGLGQFLSPESFVHGVHNTPVHFDRMTVDALNAYAMLVSWTVENAVAQWLSDQCSNQTAQELGIKFQIVVAAALHGLPADITVAQFAHEVAAASGETIPETGLPAWTREAVIVPVGFTSLTSAQDVLEFFKTPKPGVIVEPDNLMRPDGAAVFGSGESAFLLAYSA